MGVGASTCVGNHNQSAASKANKLNMIADFAWLVPKISLRKDRARVDVGKQSISLEQGTCGGPNTLVVQKLSMTLSANGHGSDKYPPPPVVVGCGG